MPFIMQNFVNNGTPLNIATFDSDACSHKEIDDKQEMALGKLKAYHNLILQYLAEQSG